MTTGSATVIDPNRMEEVSGAPIIRAMIGGTSGQVMASPCRTTAPHGPPRTALESIKSAGRKIFDHLDNHIVRPYSLQVLGARIVKATGEASLVDRIVGGRGG